jgi:arsenite-transporting ATPase
MMCLLLPISKQNKKQESKEIARKQYDRRRNAQLHWIQELEKVAEDVSLSEEYRSNNRSGSNTPISVTKVPFFDVELVGIPALTYFGNTIFQDKESFQPLLSSGNYGKTI